MAELKFGNPVEDPYTQSGTQLKFGNPVADPYTETGQVKTTTQQGAQNLAPVSNNVSTLKHNLGSFIASGTDVTTSALAALGRLMPYLTDPMSTPQQFADQYETTKNLTAAKLDQEPLVVAAKTAQDYVKSKVPQNPALVGSWSELPGTALGSMAGGLAYGPAAVPVLGASAVEAAYQHEIKRQQDAGEPPDHIKALLKGVSVGGISSALENRFGTGKLYNSLKAMFKGAPTETALSTLFKQGIPGAMEEMAQQAAEDLIVEQTIKPEDMAKSAAGGFLGQGLAGATGQAIANRTVSNQVKETEKIVEDLEEAKRLEKEFPPEKKVVGKTQQLELDKVEQAVTEKETQPSIASDAGVAQPGDLIQQTPSGPFAGKSIIIRAGRQFFQDDKGWHEILGEGTNQYAKPIEVTEIPGPDKATADQPNLEEKRTQSLPDPDPNGEGLKERKRKLVESGLSSDEATAKLSQELTDVDNYIDQNTRYKDRVKTKDGEVFEKDSEGLWYRVIDGKVTGFRGLKSYLRGGTILPRESKTQQTPTPQPPSAPPSPATPQSTTPEAPVRPIQEPTPEPPKPQAKVKTFTRPNIYLPEVKEATKDLLRQNPRATVKEVHAKLLEEFPEIAKLSEAGQRNLVKTIRESAVTDFANEGKSIDDYLPQDEPSVNAPFARPTPTIVQGSTLPPSGVRTVRDVIDWAISTKRISPDLIALAKRLRAVVGDTEFRVSSGIKRDGKDYAAGLYQEGTEVNNVPRVTLTEATLQEGKYAGITLLHELAHRTGTRILAYDARYDSNYNIPAALRPRVARFAWEIKKLYDQAYKAFQANPDSFGPEGKYLWSNILSHRELPASARKPWRATKSENTARYDEFYSYGLTNPNFIEGLKQIPHNGHSMLMRITAKLFKLPKNSFERLNQLAMEMAKVNEALPQVNLSSGSIQILPDSRRSPTETIPSRSLGTATAKPPADNLPETSGVGARRAIDSRSEEQKYLDDLLSQVRENPKPRGLPRSVAAPQPKIGAQQELAPVEKPIEASPFAGRTFPKSRQEIERASAEGSAVDRVISDYKERIQSAEDYIRENESLLEPENIDYLKSSAESKGLDVEEYRLMLENTINKQRQAIDSYQDRIQSAQTGQLQEPTKPSERVDKTTFRKAPPIGGLSFAERGQTPEESRRGKSEAEALYFRVLDEIRQGDPTRINKEWLQQYKISEGGEPNTNWLRKALQIRNIALKQNALYASDLPRLEQKKVENRQQILERRRAEIAAKAQGKLTPEVPQVQGEELRLEQEQSNLQKQLDKAISQGDTELQDYIRRQMSGKLRPKGYQSQRPLDLPAQEKPGEPNFEEAKKEIQKQRQAELDDIFGLGSAPRRSVIIPEEFRSKEEELRGTFALTGVGLAANPKEFGLSNIDKKVATQGLIGRLKNKLSPVEWHIYDSLGITKAFGQSTSPRELAQWMQENGPRVETKVLKSQGDSSERAQLKRQFYEIRHQLETKYPDPESSTDAIQSDPLFKQQIEISNRLDSLRDTEGFDPDTYRRIAPKDADQTVVLIRVPINAEVGPGKPLQSGLSDEFGREIFRGHHFGSEDKNVLAFARIQYETVNGEKVAHIFEVQSDWAPVRKAYQENAEVDSITKEHAGGLDHVLLRDYNRLALKAAIEQARADGATKIAISDSKTAMMTERHNIYDFDHPDTWWPTKEQAEEAIAQESLDGTLVRNNGGWELFINPENIEQASGMQLNYDKILPKIAQELTGDSGSLVSLGEHQNAGGFLNENNEPKRNATARLYDISKVNTKPNERFSLFNSDKLQTEGSAPRAAIKIPDKFRSKTSDKDQVERAAKSTVGISQWFLPSEYALRNSEAIENVSRLVEGHMQAKAISMSELEHYDKLMRDFSDLDDAKVVTAMRLVKSGEDINAVKRLPARLKPLENFLRSYFDFKDAELYAKRMQDIREKYTSAQIEVAQELLDINKNDNIEDKAKAAEDVLKKSGYVKSGREKVKEIYEELQRAEEFSKENYITAIEPGSWHVVEIKKDANGNEIRVNRANAKTRRAALKKKLELLKDEPNATFIPSNKETPTMGPTMESHDILRGEKTSKAFFPMYVNMINSKIYVDTPRRNLRGQLEFLPEAERQAIKALLDTSDNVASMGDSAVDAIIQRMDTAFSKLGIDTFDIEPKLFSRATALGRKVTATLGLGYRPIAAAFNRVSGIEHTWAKFGTKNYMDGIKFAQTKKGQELWAKNALKTGVGSTFDIETSASKGIKSWLHPLGMFSHAELPNRKECFFAAYEGAKKLGMEGQAAEDWANKQTRLTQTCYTAVAAPRLLRGPGQKYLGQFRAFTMNEIAFFAGMNRKEFARHIGGMIALGGMRSLTMFIKSLPIWFIGGAKDKLDEAMDYLNEHAPVLVSGLFSALPGSPDISPSATLNIPSSLKDVLGMGVGTLINLAEHIWKPLTTDRPLDESNVNLLLRESSPTWNYWNKFIDAITTGVIKNKYGQYDFIPTNAEKPWFLLGAQPKRLVDQSAEIWQIKESNKEFNDRRTAWKEKIGQLITARIAAESAGQSQKAAGLEKRIQQLLESNRQYGFTERMLENDVKQNISAPYVRLWEGMPEQDQARNLKLIPKVQKQVEEFSQKQ